VSWYGPFFGGELVNMKAISQAQSAAAAIACCVVLGACAPLQQTTNLATPIGQSVRVGVGDVVLRAEGRESLPNAFGGADIFARTRSTGLVLVQYGGLRNGKAVLLRSGITTRSDATTMDSGLFVADRNNAVYIPPRAPNVTALQQASIPIEIDWRKSPRVPMGGQTIVVESADATSIVYHLEAGP
jgi:hypothetical protein